MYIIGALNRFVKCAGDWTMFPYRAWYCAGFVFRAAFQIL